MDQFSVLFIVDDRSIEVELEDGHYFTLKASFIDFCKADKCLKDRLIDSMPVFESKNKKFKKYTEIKQNETVIDGQEIYVRWVNPQAQPPRPQVLDKPGPSRSKHQDLQGTDLKDTDNSETSSNSSSDNDEKCTWYIKAKTKFSAEEWSNMSKSERKSEAQNLEKNELLQSMNPKSVKDKTKQASKSSTVKRKKSDRTRNEKENSAPSSLISKKKGGKVAATPARRSSRQNVSSVTTEKSVPSDGPEDEDEYNIFITSNTPPNKEVPGDLNAKDTDVVPIFHDDANHLQFREFFEEAEQTNALEEREETAGSSSKTKNKKPKSMKPRKPRKPISQRRKPKRAKRYHGNQLRKNNALPNFTEKLKDDILKGCHTKHQLYMEMRDHIERHTGGLYLSSKEWTLLCGTIVTEYPLLGDIDNQKEHRSLKRGIQKSITSLRYRENEIKEIPSETVETASVVQVEQTPSDSVETASVVQVEQTPSDSVETASVVQVEQLPDEMESHLKELEAGPAQTNREMWLVKKTLQVRQKELADSTIQAHLTKYPHYKNSKMLLYEYALTTNFSLIELHKKSDLLLKKLRAHFKEENLGDNIDVIFELQEELYPAALRKRKEGSLTKLITAMDVTEAEAAIGVLDTSQEFHSPCVLLIIDVDDDGHRIIKSSHLKMFAGHASTYQFPTCSAVLLQILSPYFVFDMTYPNAYNSILRFLEKNIHGYLCETTRKLTVKQEYTKFVKKFDAK